MRSQDDKRKNPLQYTKQSQQGLLKKGGRRPPFTEDRAMPRRQEQEPISVHKAEPAGVIEKRWPKATFSKTVQSQDDKSNNPLRYTKQYQQWLLRKGSQRPLFVNQCKAKRTRARNHHGTQSRASKGYWPCTVFCKRWPSATFSQYPLLALLRVL